ncbi:MAG: hypothetical protein U0Y96_11135 [Candidatus Kapaibacterium sp.]
MLSKNTIYRFYAISTVIVCCLTLLLSCGESSEHKLSTVDTVQKTTKKQKAKHLDIPTVTEQESQQNITYKGRSINISVCGVDSRLNENVQHADANHVLRFWVDEGALEIIDIPRDTPCENAGLDSNLNNLANLRANKGRNTYLKRVAEICRIHKIDYYVELGFSQAMGVLELLGHKKEADKTLRVLRSRQGFDAGDYQRCFNQGNFMKQMALKHFDKSTGWFRDPLLRSGLFLVESNVPLDTLKYLVDKLEENGFPDNKKCYVHIMPNYGYKLPVYDLSDESIVTSLNTKIDERLKLNSTTETDQEAYCNKFNKLLSEATSDTAKKPRETIRLLTRPYNQRSWMQVKDKSKRSEYAKQVCLLLITAHNKVKQPKDALKILSFYEEHKDLLEHL